jgi:hypothetical protein
MRFNGFLGRYLKANLEHWELRARGAAVTVHKSETGIDISIQINPPGSVFLSSLPRWEI